MGGGFSGIKSGFDIIGYFLAGGFFMWPLLIVSMLSVTFTIERLMAFFLQKQKLSPATFLKTLDALIEERKPLDQIAQELVVLCEKKKGVAAEIFRAGLSKFLDAIKMQLNAIETKQWMLGGIEDSAKTELPVLDSHINVIGICYTVSPLLGLLGTVQGMIQAFMVMARSGGGAKPDELAGGIAVALITTAAGLIIAIPTMIFHAWIKSTAEGYINQIEEAATEMVDTMVRPG